MSETSFARDAAQIDAANSSGLAPVVFVHGLWLLSSSWQHWAHMFEVSGYAPVLATWPDEPETVEEANAHPEVFAGKSVGDVADHVGSLIGRLNRRPAVIGHSVGGLIAQILAGRGLAAATVAISPAPSQGLHPLPAAALRVLRPILSDPRNARKTVTLSYDQFRAGYANCVDEDEAKKLYAEIVVPGSGQSLFEVAAKDLSPFATKVDTRNPERGPMMFFSGDQDAMVPWSLVEAAAMKQSKNTDASTEITRVPGRGHSMVVDSTWIDLADAALGYVQGCLPA
jgi:pimeloyl-ACP methyl ester carboxylesterase